MKMNIRKFFIFKKRKPLHEQVRGVDVVAVGPVICPSCRECALFHYEAGEIKSHPAEFWLCENCNRVFDKDLKVEK